MNGHDCCVVSIAVSEDARWVVGHGVVVAPDPVPNSGTLRVFDTEDGTARFPAVPLAGYGIVRYGPTLAHIVVNAALGHPRPGAPSAGLSVIDALTGVGVIGATPEIGAFDFTPEGASIVAVGRGFIESYELPLA